MAGDLEYESPVPPFVKEASGWRPFHRESAEYERPRREPQILYFALPLLADGRLAPVIDSVYTLDEVAAAHRRMEANANIGKIVLRVPTP